jgi:hypothetical protein
LKDAFLFSLKAKRLLPHHRVSEKLSYSLKLVLLSEMAFAAAEQSNNLSPLAYLLVSLHIFFFRQDTFYD